MTKPFVFVLMPFDPQFDDVYKLGIKATCEELNTYCERLDEQIFEENMLERIYNQIAKADIVIADLTGKNANVFYETGYAHALDKKVILLTNSSKDIPFDLKHHFHILYHNIVTLKSELKKRIQWYISNPERIQLPSEDRLKFYMNGIEILTGKQIKILESQFSNSVHSVHKITAILVKIDTLNCSKEIYESPLKIGVLIKQFRETDNPESIKTIRLSEDEYLHVSKNMEILYPNSWESIEFNLKMPYNNQIKSKPIPMIIRLFSVFGTTDIPVEVMYEEMRFGEL